MRNPLSRRHVRELRHNLGKYLGLFLMMVFAVSFTSGFLLAASSIERICDDMAKTYRIEDGRFSCDFEPKDEALDAIRKLDVTWYRDFYKQVDLRLAGNGDDGMTARVYATREQVNLPAYAQGRAPQGSAEVALDRVFCENHKLAVGDSVTLANKPFTLTGILTLPDYQALFEDNNSFMFNAITFTVAMVDPQAYHGLEGASEVFNYAFTFDDQSLTRDQRVDVEEEMIDALADHDAQLSSFIDAQDNQGIGYALDDVRGDQAMWTVLLFLLVIIMGFVFVVLTGATIEQESAVIGTMLASGWRKRELVRHYLFLPAVIGLLASALGLAVGVGLLCDPFKDLYYHSYSLPPYHTIWNWQIVLVTAVLPYALLVGITLYGLLRNLRFTPLQFLRHEAAGRRRNSRLRLPERLSYATRFRIRVLARNASHFVTLFFGIMFASLLLLFGLCMLPVVENYAGLLRQTVAAPHEYVLKAPLELEGTDEQRRMYAAALRLAEDHDRIEANQDAIDALERLEDNDTLIDALERLQDNWELMDSLERLQNDTGLVDAVRRLRDNQALLDAADRLRSQQALVDAAERLESKQDLVVAAERLRDRQDVVAAVQRMQARPELLALAQRVQSGTGTEADAAALAHLDEQSRADLQIVASVDAQTVSDMQAVASMDAQTRSDLELVANMSEQTRADLELMRNVDDQTRDDLELLSNLNEEVRSDLDRITKAEGQTKADLQTLMDLDDKTRADVDLIRNMDRDLLDDLRLAGNIDEDAHVVNTQANSPAAIAQAEKYAMATVEVERAFGGEYEEVTVYGIQPDSRYWTEIPISSGKVVAGKGLIEKTKAQAGATVTVHDRREGTQHTLEVGEEASNAADTALYMALDDFNRLFGNDADYFNAYASAQTLQLDGRYVASSIVPEDMDEISNQMHESMGNIMTMMMLMSVPIYLILVFLLTKTVIDRSSRSISYMKVFGYRNREVDGLYIRPITGFVLLSLVASIPLIIAMLSMLLKVVFMRYSGNFPIVIPPDRLVLLVAVGMAAYALVAFLHVRRIRRVPLSLALKIQE